MLLSGLSLSILLLLHACGSGGGGGGTNNNPTPTPPPSASAKVGGTASKAVATALNLAASSISSAASGSGAPPSLGALLKPGTSTELSETVQVRQALDAVKTAIAAREKVTALPSTQCSGGGTITVTTDDNNTPSNFLDDTTTSTYDNCTESGTVTNGSLATTFLDNGLGLTFTYSNYVIHSTFSGSISETAITGGLTFHSTTGTCGFEGSSFTDNLTLTSKVDQTGDGTFEVNTALAVNLTMTITEAHDAAPACTPGATTVDLNGGTRITSSSAAANQEVTFTDFKMVLTPTTRTINNVDTKGETLSLNGAIAISSGCTGSAATTFTISTPEGEEPFVPKGKSCPVSGRFLIAHGSSLLAVIYTPTGGVQVDEGNNGSIDTTFTSCKEAGLCS
ncbi:MAG: hypothetical protein HY282_07720 [Nitrospirae bacterium]|nr:hypothetical protein [Candidatus Manganitrophaceae bacterium]